MYSITEFSKLIGVSVPTLRNWHSNGKLIPESITVGGQRRYSEEQANEYLTSQKLDLAFCNNHESNLMQEYTSSSSINFRLIIDDSSEVVEFVISRRLRSLLVYSTTSFKDFELIKYLCKRYKVSLKIVSDIKGGDDNVWD